MIIRKETPADFESITNVTVEAFKSHPISRQTEHFIIRALRAAEALTLSLVVEINGQIVGHIAFSPIEISDGTQEWFGLGPISVLPEYQQKGIGTALINKGLSELKDLGAQGCALVGMPEYYNRFGFKNFPQLIHEGIPQEVFLVLPFYDKVPKGTVTFHKAFNAES
ncbi:GNAT family N-acetyltransferase [Thiomicrorhabdus sp.]|uniref:GNAT family N-acetyltransferase n=1 Tax=Thiomicrorhabdus sp. TaxID=2039724 RepID=UPI0035654E41